MLDRIARLPGAPCLLARGTRQGGVAFCHANGSSRAISADRGEINSKNIAVRSEYFRSYHLPVLSAEQNNSQSEETNIIDKSWAKNRPVPVQEAEIRWKKVSLVGRCVSDRSRDNSRSPLTIPVKGAPYPKMDKKVGLNLVKLDQLCAITLMTREEILRVLLKMVAMATSHSLWMFCLIALTPTTPVLLQNKI